jgi:hypothetical protein
VVPLAGFLSAYKAIEREVGPNVLTDIGVAITTNAPFPPGITDIVKGQMAIDVAYHLNHRRAGMVMFDPATGKMLEGIGHYTVQQLTGEKKLLNIGANPYPCSFDLGVVTAMAQRFEARAKVVHDTARPCRSKGGSECHYVITW